MTPQPLFQNTFILREPLVVIFADIIKILTMFIKTIFKGSKKFEELEIVYQSLIYFCISWYTKIC